VTLRDVVDKHAVLDFAESHLRKLLHHKMAWEAVRVFSLLCHYSIPLQSLTESGRYTDANGNDRIMALYNDAMIDLGLEAVSQRMLQNSDWDILRLSKD